MSLLSQQEKERIRKAIATAEQKTDAELVAVLAKQSDSYHYIPVLWAAIFALLSPLMIIFLPFWLGTADSFVFQMLIFITLALAFQISALQRFLIPKPIAYWRAANMARRQFIENNLHHTKGATGILIFVSEKERYVEIIADRGINQFVEAEQWQKIVAQFILSIKQKQTSSGLTRCIDACAELLHKHVPLTEEKNELPNHLIILE